MYQQYRHMFSFNNKRIVNKLITRVHPGVGGGDQLETLGQESGGGTALSKTNKQSVVEATQQLHDDDEVQVGCRGVRGGVHVRTL